MLITRRRFCRGAFLGFIMRSRLMLASSCALFWYVRRSAGVIALSCCRVKPLLSRAREASVNVATGAFFFILSIDKLWPRFSAPREVPLIGAPVLASRGLPLVGSIEILPWMSIVTPGRPARALWGCEAGPGGAPGKSFGSGPGSTAC